MGKKNWGIITNTQLPPGVHETLGLDSLDSHPEEAREQIKDTQTRLFYVDDTIHPGAFYSELVWINKTLPEDKAHFSHRHEYDELIYFIGSDPKNHRDLGGEVEVWIEDEKQVLTQTCVIFVPAGTMHGPFVFKRVDRPILHGAVLRGDKFQSVPPT